MKKTLHERKERFVYIRNGVPHPWNLSIKEILDAVNRALKGDWGPDTKETIILKIIYEWISRYLEEGATDEFCNDLNADLKHMQFLKHVVPPAFFHTEDKNAQSLYVVNRDKNYPHEVHAATDVSQMITTGMLDKIKRCQMTGCENIFVGPPQAKWCSKTCGSKYRVREKRRRDSS